MNICLPRSLAARGSITQVSYRGINCDMKCGREGEGGGVTGGSCDYIKLEPQSHMIISQLHQLEINKYNNKKTFLGGIFKRIL